MLEYIKNITETIEGYPVKNLKYNEKDNIIVGLVKDPTLGNPKVNDGWICVQWRKNGYTTNRYKGIKELQLKIVYE